MTDTTTDEIADIRARWETASSGQWMTPFHEEDPHLVIAHGGFWQSPIGRLDFTCGDNADADRTFVMHAHNDMITLFREIDRLRDLIADEHSRLSQDLDNAEEIVRLRAALAEHKPSATLHAVRYADGRITHGSVAWCYHEAATHPGAVAVEADACGHTGDWRESEGIPLDEDDDDV